MNQNKCKYKITYAQKGDVVTPSDDEGYYWRPMKMCAMERYLYILWEGQPWCDPGSLVPG